MSNEWKKGTGTPLAGGDAANTIDDYVDDYIQQPLERLLNNYRENCVLAYASAATLTIAAGELCCTNAALDVRKFRQNTAVVTVTWADIDTGGEATSTTYYVYAVADADANTFTAKISASATAPSGVTSYRRLGSFYNNASGDIEQVTNDTNYYTSGYGTLVSKSNNTAYHADTDGIVTAFNNPPYGGGSINEGYTDAANPPTTLVAYGRINASASYIGNVSLGITFPVKKGNYWKALVTYGTAYVYWVPTGS